MISVITPVYLESSRLVNSAIEHLASFKGISEIIVVTAEQDPLADEITRLITTLYAGNPRIILSVSDLAGRARQMNLGAKIAQSEYLLFVHADTRLPEAADDLIASRLIDSPWGRFNLKLDDSGTIFRILSCFINWRSRLTHICTGDQALFMTRQFFNQAGGFPEQQLMEDIEFSIRAKKVSLPAVIQKPVITSARRWKHHGVIKTVILMWRLRLLYWFGVPASALAKHYRNAR